MPGNSPVYTSALWRYVEVRFFHFFYLTGLFGAEMWIFKPEAFQMLHTILEKRLE